MYTKTGNKVMNKIVTYLRYDEKKALNMYIAVLAIVPIIFFIYIAFTLNLAQMGLQDYFYKSPITTVMFIVCLVDLVVSYVLFFEKNTLLTNKKSMTYIFAMLTIAQLAVGNLISAVLGIIVLYLTKDIEICDQKLNKNSLCLLIVCIPLYTISALFLINIGIH